MAPDTAGEAAPTSRPLRLTDLPREIQKDIVGHCQQHDLICLSLVSSHFRELAAAELYRNFHIVFPDEDDRAYDSPIDGLASGLETFVTSDYDYAKHLRDISLDTLSTGDKAESAYKSYLYSLSCGKFLNTLLLLTLRKAKALETLRWNIRVELSRPVYKALHDIETLSHLHIRLQEGSSLYEQPLPLPFSSSTTASSVSTSHLPTPGAPPPAPTFTLPPPPGSFYIPPSATTLSPPLPKPHARTKASKRSSALSNPPTLSGFKKLKTLSVLDIDDLDVITELKTCIGNSQGTLTKLKLSLSYSMAMRARKESDPDDSESSDPDDEFQVGLVVVPPPTQPYDDVSGPARAFRAQEERKTQESVLGRIFDVEPSLPPKPTSKPRDKANEAAAEEVAANPGLTFINSIKAVSERLMKRVSGSEDLTAAQQDILDMIQTAAKTYVSEQEGNAVVPTISGANGGNSTNGANGTGTAKPAAAEASVERGNSGLDAVKQDETSLFGSKIAKGKETAQDVSPDDIDIEEPVEDSFEEFPEGAPPESVHEADGLPPKQTPPATHGIDHTSGANNIPSKLGPSTAKAVANLEAQKRSFETLAEKLDSYEIQAEELHKEMLQLPGDAGPRVSKRLRDAEKQIHEFRKNIKSIQHEMSVIGANIQDVEKQIPAEAKTGGTDAVLKRINEYTRSTRGLSLRSLGIHLIPVKASVLSRAIDLRVLKRITLLNVGPQAPIWTLLAKENSMQPIALRKIFTDNVSLQFLTFVSQLEELHELFMLERPDKYKPEPFAPKTIVTSDQIRRLALKRHTRTLRRLMIKNQQDATWDVDEKMMLLICRRGGALEELAVSMAIRAVHTLLQHMSGLANLRALHIINLRNDDTCMWVMRETKRFIIDNLSHYPELKLEWLAIDDDEHVDRIIRWKEPAKGDKSKSSKSKGKEKAPATMTNGDQFPVLSLDDLNLGSESDEDENDRGSGDGASKLETIDTHFYEVWGVRIFKREIISGRL